MSGNMNYNYSDDSNNLLSETATSDSLSFGNSCVSNSVLSDNPSDHYSPDGLSPEKTVPVKENGSCDGSSDENTVATGSSGSVPSDHSFFKDDKIFIRNKQALRN